MMPIVNRLEDEFSGQLTVLRLNADVPESAALMQVYGLRGHPSFALVNGDGRVSQTFFGPISEEQLRISIQMIAP
jgi:thioredoxin-like negative regulator of GroEL